MHSDVLSIFISLYKPVYKELTAYNYVVRVILTSVFYFQPAANLRAALTVGLIICCLIEGFAHVSGAHFNPIVTLMFVLTKRTSVVKGN